MGPAAAQAAFPGSNGDIVFIGVHQPPGAPVYSPQPPGVSGIYVTNPDGTEVRALKMGSESWAAPNPEGFGGPTWSPDGSKIAYSHWSDGAGQIEVMAPDGSGSQPIGPTDAWAPAWSPDGSMIAFADAARNDLYVMDAGGRNPRLLVAESSAWGESATWSPDCSRIAFSADGLWTMRPDGRVHIVSGGYGPDWSPDGRKLVYWRYGDGDGPAFRLDLFVVNADGSGERHLRSGVYPAWSPDGTRIVFARRGGLATMNADGSDVRTVTVTDSTTHWHGLPDWQPLIEAAPRAGLCDAWRTDLDALSTLRVSVRPRTAQPNEPTTFRFKVTREGGRRVRRAVIYFAGQQTRTNARGKAAITREFPYNVVRRAVATKAGFRHDTVTVRTPPES